MRAFTAMVIALCTMGFPMQVHAVGMKFCDDIQDDRSRMACLQEHISQLEETIVTQLHYARQCQQMRLSGLKEPHPRTYRSQ